MEITRQSLLQLIDAARLEQNLTMKAVERMADVPADSLRDFYRGKVRVLRADKLQKVLKVLGYRMDITKSPAE